MVGLKILEKVVRRSLNYDPQGVVKNICWGGGIREGVKVSSHVIGGLRFFTTSKGEDLRFFETFEGAGVLETSCVNNVWGHPNSQVQKVGPKMTRNIGIMQITYQFGPFCNVKKLKKTHLGQSRIVFIQN